MTHMLDVWRSVKNLKKRQRFFVSFSLKWALKKQLRKISREIIDKEWLDYWITYIFLLSVLHLKDVTAEELLTDGSATIII